MLLSPKRFIIYGPVRSRRLGRSLGINILPSGRKVCTFDCRYCQYGWTDPADHTGDPAPYGLATPESVADALRDILAAPEKPDYLTFSGNGEPTLHPRFGDVVDAVIAVRDRMAPRARTAILSNSSRVTDPAVRDALAKLDVRIMKLDTGTEERFRAYNGAIGGLRLDRIVEGLRQLPDVTLQTLFTAGPAGNMDPPEVDAWIERVTEIRPRSVQIYSLDRSAPCDEIETVPRARLEEIASRLAALGIEARVF